MALFERGDQLQRLVSVRVLLEAFMVGTWVDCSGTVSTPSDDSTVNARAGFHTSFLLTVVASIRHKSVDATALLRTGGLLSSWRSPQGCHVHFH
jgi:hypothetical protein